MGEQPPATVPPVGPQPPMGWAPPPPAPHNRGLVIAVVTLSVLLLVACAGLAGGAFLLRSAENLPSGRASEAPLSRADDRLPSAGATPTESAEPVQQGPYASEYPASKSSDLDRVCDDNVYYPQSPKRAGKAPHPVVLLMEGGSGIRFQNGTYYYDEGLSKRAEQTWAAEDASKVQMVACLDRVSTGATIRRCRFDEPKPLTLTLLRAGWRLRVYEVATGRKLLDKAMTGDDQKCPYVVLAGPDKKIYAEVSNQAVLAALRKLVTR
ncbi:hypothetical protein OG799_33275 [Micromonospora sp. NBC_00898]|uniref:hypothetical protein n=1 Tax=Micromonospora sp. NBC_00898 TaxID=2975981 RepID=UPI00386850BD|nr:hypothetical protein OG799_33275 [Micromonospora sp. NBC_00898]